MKNKNNTIFIMIVLVVIVLSGCPNIFGDDSSSKGDGDPALEDGEPVLEDGEPAPVDGDPASPNPSTILSFDLSGASAIGLAEVGASTSNLSGSSLLSPQNAPDASFGLVKVLEDGTVELAMQAPDNVWLPEVNFIAIDPNPNDRNVYVSFQHDLWLGWDDEAQQEIRLSSFLHIRPDGTYYEVLPDQRDGRVATYSWWGNESYKPVSFDGNGNIYFVYQRWASNGEVNVLYRYNPDTQQATALTAQLTGFHYESFQVNPEGNRLFVQGRRYTAGGEATFFRIFDVNDMTNPRTVFYSSGNDVWIRGYTITPDGQELIMNGYNIRGINGIIRATVDADLEVTYDSLFDSNTSDWFSPEYHEWYSEWEDRTHRRGLFDRVNRWDTYVVLTDGTDFFYVSLSSMLSTWSGRGGQTVWGYDSIANNQQVERTLGGDSGVHFAIDLDDASQQVHIPADTKDADNHPVIALKAANVEWGDNEAVFGIRRYHWDGGVETRTFDPVANDIVQQFIDDATGTENEVFVWNDYWVGTDGKLDAGALETFLGQYFADEIEFQYGGLTGQAAWDAFQAEGPYSRDDIHGPHGGNPYHLLEQYFYIPGTANNAITVRQFRDDNSLPWLDFASIGSMFHAEDGSLWGILGGAWGSRQRMRPLRLLDDQGKKGLGVVSALDDGNHSPVGFAIDGNHLYFRDAVMDSDNFETGYHHLYRVNILQPNAPAEDVLTNLGAANGRIEIVDFSVGAGFLYFTAVDGIELRAGRVNTTTLEYEPFDEEYVITSIEVY